MNGFDLSTVTNIYLGSTPVKKVYMGTKLIWSTKADEYSTEYFTIESLEDGNQIGIIKSDMPSISISTDKQTWTTVTPNASPTYFITLNAGKKVYIKGNNNTYYDGSWPPHGYFTSTGQFNVSGNIMSLIYADDFKNKTTLSSSNTNAFTKLFYAANNLISAEHLVLPATTLADSCYVDMFNGCSSLTTAPQLPATTLAQGCYQYMFNGCSSLTTAPQLPATTLASGCYRDMFNGCRSLTTAPELPATTLASGCYRDMFHNCSSLTTAPELPATTLADYCYQDMFNGCRSLTTAPELPATTLTDTCYGGMFNDCRSLTTAPELPATTLAHNCYNYMFYGCSSLTTAPELPATTLAEGCYGSMFNSCTQLTTAPELPVTTLAYWCYDNMFNGCSSLTKAPELPATTLADHCYEAMFYGCTRLTKAPQLPATTLANRCYYRMFKYCSSLNYIKMLATDVSATDCLAGWVNGVASSGTFVKDASTTLPTGENGIPDGWTVEAADYYATEYFTIESLEDDNQIGIADSDRPSISISTDKRTWTTVTPNTAPTYFITLNAGQKVYIKGSNDTYSDWSTEGYFTSTNKFNVSGNIMSLIYADDFKNKTTLSSSNSFAYLFSGADKLISAEHLVLPATTLADSCYESMFNTCMSLTTAPELPATTLADFCYASMFRGCSFTTAPELPATTLVDFCYYNMFYNCIQLNYIKMLATDVSANNCLTGWVNNVASSGTFVKDASATLPTGENGIPDGWTVEAADYYATEYFTIESLEDDNQIGIADSDRPSISISTDKRTWTTVTPNTAPTYFITLNAGQKVYIKGSNDTYSDWSTEGYFTSTNKFNVSGNIMSLIYADDFKNKTTLSSSNSFAYLFSGADKLISAEHLVLPATTLADSCYESMFNTCMSLTTAPELPATTLADFCYASMFMWCSSLNYIKMLATDVSATDCLACWVTDVAPSGTFVKDASTTLPTGENGIPDGWTVEAA